MRRSAATIALLRYVDVYRVTTEVCRTLHQQPLYWAFQTGLVEKRANGILWLTQKGRALKEAYDSKQPSMRGAGTSGNEVSDRVAGFLRVVRWHRSKAA